MVHPSVRNIRFEKDDLLMDLLSGKRKLQKLSGGFDFAAFPSFPGEKSQEAIGWGGRDFVVVTICRHGVGSLGRCHVQSLPSTTLVDECRRRGN